jgi:stress-induced-phosphoprotein 1
VERSAVFVKLMDFGRAQEDVEKAILLDPTKIAAYARKGKIETFTKRYNRALDSYRKGLKLDPTNSDCKEVGFLILLLTVCLWFCHLQVCVVRIQ